MVFGPSIIFGLCVSFPDISLCVQVACASVSADGCAFLVVGLSFLFVPCFGPLLLHRPYGSGAFVSLGFGMYLFNLALLVALQLSFVG